jgi:hypothetical protein
MTFFEDNMLLHAPKRILAFTLVVFVAWGGIASYAQEFGDNILDYLPAFIGKKSPTYDPAYNVELQSAITALGSNQGTIQVPPGTNLIAEDISIPANVSLKIEQGAVLSIAAGKKLTINGFLDAGLYQIFSGTGKVQFGPGAVREIVPQWFGAKADGATDNSAAIQAMFDSIPLNTYYGWRVHFPNGIYYVASEINLPGLSADWDHGASTTFYITGDGATLYTDQPISIFKRWPPDVVTSPNRYANTAFVVDGMTFRGTRLRNQVGLDLACTYGSKITNCRFEYLGRGLRLSYAMMPVISNCLSNNCIIAGYTANSGYGMWDPSGTGWNTNTSIYQYCRAYVNDTANVDIEGLSKANPCVVTWTGHGLKTGDIIFIDGITQDAVDHPSDWVSLNKRHFQITKINDNLFSLQTLNRTRAGADFDTSTFTNPYSLSDPGKIQWATWGFELIDTFGDTLTSCVIEGNAPTDKIFYYSPSGYFNQFTVDQLHSENAAYGSTIYLNTNGAIYDFLGLGGDASPISLDLYDMASNIRATIRITNFSVPVAGCSKIRLPQDCEYCAINFDIKGMNALGDSTDLTDPKYWYGGKAPRGLVFQGMDNGTYTQANQFIFSSWRGMVVIQDPNAPISTYQFYKGLRSEANPDGGGGVGAYDPVNGQSIMVKQKAAEIPITASGVAIQDLSRFIPAGVMVVGFTARVTVAICGASSLSVGETGSANLWINAMGVTLGATGDLSKATATTPMIYAAATTVRLTANGGNFNGTGKVRLTVHYISLEAPAN